MSSRTLVKVSFVPVVLNALNIALCSMESNAFSESMCLMQSDVLNSLHFFFISVDWLFEDDQLSSNLL